MHSADMRDRFLRALLEYADESGTFNPHFHRKEMMQRVGLSEGEFNIVQKQLGDKYCRYVDQHDGDARYQICVSDCLALADLLEQNRIQACRHRQLMRWAVFVAILGAVLGAVLSYWLRKS